MSQVICVDDGEDHKQNAIIDASGVVRIKRGRQDVAMPRDTEELRRRLRTWGFSFTFAKLKHPTRAWLMDATPDVIAEYCDYLLGDTVRGLKARNDKGEVVAAPSFQQILHYEYQVRKEQAKLIAKGSSFKDALVAACADYALRERHFVTPMAVSAISSRPAADSRQGPRSRSPHRGSSSGQAQGKGSKGGNKGGKSVSKGGGKKQHKRGTAGKGSSKGKGATNTPDGQPICFNYNNEGAKCPGSCGRAHVGRKCFGSHPSYLCPGSNGPSR